MKNLRALILVLTIGLSASPAFAVTVRKALDSNTVGLDNGQAIRLIGIDWKGPDSAKEFISKIADVHDVIVELDPDLVNQDHEDIDKMIMGYVYLTAPSDPSEVDVVRDDKNRIFLNASLLAAGHGKIRLQPSFQRFSEFVHHEAEARRGKKGQWSKE